MCEKNRVKLVHIKQRVVKMKILRRKNDNFLIYAQNIDCRYSLELPRGDVSNEYPQSMLQRDLAGSSSHRSVTWLMYLILLVFQRRSINSPSVSSPSVP